MDASYFIRGLLDDPRDPQLPQYDPAGGWNTARFAGQRLAAMTGPGGVADAFGLLGEPSAMEQARSGDYLGAGLTAAGVIPGVGALKAMAMIPKAGKAGAKMAKSAEDLAAAVPKVPDAPVLRTRKLTEAAAAAEGQPDLFDFSRLSDVPNVPQFDLPRYVPARGVPERTRDLVANKDVREKMLGIISEGRKIGGQEWYNTEPLRDYYIRELGSAGEPSYNLFMDLNSATSPRSDVGTNIRNASYYNWLLANGKGAPAVGTQNPQPYGHMAQRLHQQNVQTVANGGWDPIKNPKPPSFGEDLKGNQLPVAVDTHAFRAPTILAQDPRFLMTSYKPEKGVEPINFRKKFENGEMSMQELLNTPVAWEAVPKDNEYGAMEQFYKGLGQEVGLTPAQAQASAWVGGAAHTGLKSDESKPFMRFFQERIYLTAQKLNMDPKDVLRKFVRGEMPLLSAAPAGLLGAGMMSQSGQGQEQSPAQ